MQVSSINDVKVYNLSYGETLPEWLSARQKRKLQQSNDAVRRRIQLIQDFEMPDVSGCIQMSKDGRYVMATGTYKPVLRCFELENLSMKFERCVDAEVIKMVVLSDGFDKIAFLEEERYIEFHTRQGHYFKTRIPKFGRDMAYHEPSCDLFVVGCSPEVYRFNLEEGRFMQPFVTSASSLLSCSVNPVHHLFVCGTAEGHLEAWDPRSQERVSRVDCALHCVGAGMDTRNQLPNVCALTFKDSLTLAVGCSTGQTLLYDIRSDKPLLVKDQQNGMPIKQLAFTKSDGDDIVLSLDSQSLKLWHEHSGTPFTSIQPEFPLNQMCVVKDSGVVFLTNESPKMMTYYIPALGPAPKWCSFLDNITEELEETERPDVFDGYKFVSKDELESLGMTNLIGTNLLRAYMHGYFVDARLHAKAVQVKQPFQYEQYRKKKLKEKVDAELEASRVSLKPVIEGKLPSVNRDLALRLKLEEKQLADSDQRKKMKGKKKKRAQEAATLLTDDRFSALFANPDFQVDPDSEEFMLLNPALEKLQTAKKKRQQKLQAADDKPSTSALATNAESGANKDDDDDNQASTSGGSSSSSSDENDDMEYKQKVKETHKALAVRKKLEQQQRRKEQQMQQALLMHKSAEQMKAGHAKLRMYAADSASVNAAQLQQDASLMSRQAARLSMADRVAALGQEEDADEGEVVIEADGGRTMTFQPSKRGKFATRKERNEAHVKERRATHRSGSQIERKLSKPKSLMPSAGGGSYGSRGAGRGGSFGGRGGGRGGRGRGGFRGGRGGFRGGRGGGGSGDRW